MKWWIIFYKKSLNRKSPKGVSKFFGIARTALLKERFPDSLHSRCCFSMVLCANTRLKLRFFEWSHESELHHTAAVISIDLWFVLGWGLPKKVLGKLGRRRDLNQRPLTINASNAAASILTLFFFFEKHLEMIMVYT